jgi:hypothetical protein
MAACEHSEAYDGGKLLHIEISHIRPTVAAFLWLQAKPYGKEMVNPSKLLIGM